MGLLAPVRAVERDHCRLQNLAASGIVPLQWLLVIGDGEADGDPIAQCWRQAEYLFVEADDAPLRGQEPARRNRLDRIPPAAKIEDVDRSPAIAPDADRADRLDAQGSRIEGCQSSRPRWHVRRIDSEGSLEEARRD